MSLFNALPEKSFLKKVLTGVDSEFTERILQTKINYEKATEKEDKRLYKDKMTALFWELFTHIARMINPDMSSAKRLFLRYGIFDLRYLSPEDQKMILNQPVTPPDFQNDTIFYVDEWLQGIADGKIRPSSVDETSTAPVASMASYNPADAGRIEKYESIIAVEKDRHKHFVEDREKYIQALVNVANSLLEYHTDDTTGLVDTFTAEQNKDFDNIQAIQKEIRKLNKEITGSLRAIAKAQDSLSEYTGGDAAGTTPSHDNYSAGISKVLGEIGSIRQMMKMTVGRQGNSFPYLSSSNIPKETREYLFKENVKKRIDHWLSLDPEAFNRTYKGQDMAIPPYIILVPGFGSIGLCWEPLEPTNKQFGKGRLGLPIFSRTPDISLLAAIGDARWQVAKEIASYYWMEEGLTGRYYEYYLAAKLKGDLKTLFVKDYILWMTKETQGMQKLEQDARYVFWRYVPMPDERKIALSKKGYYYTQLWEKEQVWRQGKENK